MFALNTVGFCVPDQDKFDRFKIDLFLHLTRR